MYILRCLFRYMQTIEMDTAIEEHTESGGHRITCAHMHIQV